MSSKNLIAAVVALPPPVHGSSVMNQLVVEMLSQLPDVEIRPIEISFSATVSEIGSFSSLKILKQMVKVLKVTLTVARLRPSVSYLAPAVAEMGAIRDGLLVLLVKCFSRDVIVHIHGRGLSKPNRGWLERILFKLVYSGTHAIHLSDGLAQSIQDVANWKSVVSIPNGVLDSPTRPTETKTSEEPKRLLFLSNLVQSKGIGDFLEICSLLKARNVDYRATVVGAASPDLSLETLQRRVTEQGLDRHIQLVGPSYGSAKEQIMADSDIFVFPSFYPNECCPLVVLEALSAGLPVLAYDIGALTEMVDTGVSGYITQSRDIEALCSHVLSLLNDPDKLQKMSRAARGRYEEFFTQEKFKQRLLDYFRTFDTSRTSNS